LMVFNVTFNNISAISWQAVLLVEKTTNLSQVTDKLYHIMLYTSLWSLTLHVCFNLFLFISIYLFNRWSTMSCYCQSYSIGFIFVIYMYMYIMSRLPCYFIVL
jgi:hypothetical protein